MIPEAQFSDASRSSRTRRPRARIARHRSRLRQQVTVRRGLRRITRHPAVRAVVADELLKVGQQGHARRISPRSASAA